MLRIRVEAYEGGLYGNLPCLIVSFVLLSTRSGGNGRRGLWTALREIWWIEANSLIRHPCISDKPTQYRLPRTTTVVCFSVTVVETNVHSGEGLRDRQGRDSEREKE